MIVVPVIDQFGCEADVLHYVTGVSASVVCSCALLQLVGEGRIYVDLTFSETVRLPREPGERLYFL
jgi:hypothetical protein